MSSINLSYPIIVFKKKDSMIYVYRRKFFITTVDLVKFYSNTIVIDSEGKEYLIQNAEIEKSKGFSLLYLEKMFQVKLILNRPLSKVSLDDLKVKTMNQVKLKPKFWLSMDTIDGIQERIDKAKTFKELILIFK